MLYIVLCRTKWRVHTLVCRCEMINFMSYVHLPRIQMTNMCTHEMFPWQFDKRQKNSYLRQTENVWALGRKYHFKVGGEGEEVIKCIWLHGLKSLLLKKLLQAQLIVSFCQTPWEENVSWWMAHMNFTYYCSCHGFAVTFCFLLAGGKTPDVNDRTFANVMRSSALDREKVSLFYRRKNYCMRSKINGN